MLMLDAQCIFPAIGTEFLRYFYMNCRVKRVDRDLSAYPRDASVWDIDGLCPSEITPCLRYKHQPVNAVCENNRVDCDYRNIHTLWKKCWWNNLRVPSVKKIQIFTKITVSGSLLRCACYLNCIATMHHERKFPLLSNPWRRFVNCMSNPWRRETLSI